MPSFKIIGLPVLKKKSFEDFTIYGCGGHLGHVIWTIYINFLSPFPRRLHMKFSLDLRSGFRKKIFANGGHIHVYSPVSGTDNPLGQMLFIYIIIQSFAAIFPIK